MHWGEKRNTEDKDNIKKMWTSHVNLLVGMVIF